MGSAFPCMPKTSLPVSVMHEVLAQHTGYVSHNGYVVAKCWERGSHLWIDKNII